MKIYEDRKNRLTQKIQDIQDLGGKKFRLPAFTATSTQGQAGLMDKALLDLEQELDDDLLRLKAIEKKQRMKFRSLAGSTGLVFQ